MRLWLGFGGGVRCSLRGFGCLKPGGLGPRQSRNRRAEVADQRLEGYLQRRPASHSSQSDVLDRLQAKTGNPTTVSSSGGNGLKLDFALLQQGDGFCKSGAYGKALACYEQQLKGTQETSRKCKA